MLRVLLLAALALSAVPLGASSVSASGCGLGVRRGPDFDCTPVYSGHRHRRAYWHGYADGYRQGYYDGLTAATQPDVSYYDVQPVLPLPTPAYCGLGYRVSCAFGVCRRHCY